MPGSATFRTRDGCTIRTWPTGGGRWVAHWMLLAAGYAEAESDG